MMLLCSFHLRSPQLMVTSEYLPDVNNSLAPRGRAGGGEVSVLLSEKSQGNVRTFASLAILGIKGTLSPRGVFDGKKDYAT